ncbi:MAG: ABC transporter ATP-binding protein [Microgenomates group bacterium]
MSKSVLVVDQLHKVYPAEKKNGTAFTAVKNISFELKKGEILGLLGPNGAGKSTTISMLMGNLTPTSGSIQYFGQELSEHKSDILEQVTFASTYIKMPWRLTVMENLKIYALLYCVGHEAFLQRAERFLGFFGVWDQRFKTMNQLSAGQVTRIMLAKAFIPHPKVVLLDEPTASLDPDIAHQVRQFVKEQQKNFDTSILYTSHNMDEVADVCDRVMFLREGSILAIDTPENLAKSVSGATMHLEIIDGLKRVNRFCGELNLEVTVEGRRATIKIDEQEVASFLSKLAGEKITYSSIAIDTPTLEDYFLQTSGVKKS